MQQPFELTPGLDSLMLNIARSNLAASPAAAENLRVTDFDDYLPVTLDDGRKNRNFSDYSGMTQQMN
jgi:hypothetical protein